MNRQYNARVITEGAMMAAIFVLISVISYYTPIGAISTFALSAPAAILTFRQGLRPAVLSSIAGSVVLALMVDPIWALTSALMLQLMGLVLGWGLRKRYTPYLTLLAGTAAGMVGIVAMALVSWYVLGINVVQEMIVLYRESSEQSLAIFQKFNVPEESLMAIKQIPQMVELFAGPLMPSILLLTSMALAFVNLAIIREVLRRLGSPTEGLPPFGLLKLPRYFIWGFLLAFLGLTISQQLQAPTLRSLFMNLYNLANILFTVQGLAIAVFYMGKWNTPKLMQVFGIFMLVSTPIFPPMLLMFGLLDYTFDFRRIGPARGA